MSSIIEQKYGHLHICTLLDFYGDLLSERQKEIMTLFYYEDLSLFEISELKSISRQAANSLIHRAVDRLKEFDQTLGLVQNFEKNKMLKDKFKEALAAKDWSQIEEIYKLWQPSSDTKA